MQVLDFVILAAVAVWFLAAVRSTVRKKGGCGCAGDCCGCDGCGQKMNENSCDACRKQELTGDSSFDECISGKKRGSIE